MKEILPREPDEIRAWRWTEEALYLLDQRRLPHTEAYVRCRRWQEVRDAIRKMVVRGAPAIGIVASIGVYLGARSIKVRRRSTFLRRLSLISSGMTSARPTAVNLFWAVRRVVARAEGETDAGPEELKELIKQEALSIWEEDLAANRKMGAFGAELVPDGATILTHCNAGALATGGYGTALGVVRAAREAGKEVSVLVDETRPYLQGARLTAWELKRLGIPFSLIVDSAAHYFMARGEVNLVVVGADRIARNGDTANKVGTYGLAVSAHFHGVPFLVAAPSSTFDLSLLSGASIPIEERSSEEVFFCGGRRTAPSGISARNPSFDVTPAALVTAFVTEKGVIRPPFEKNIPEVLTS